jgi:hypothetical protein
MLTYFLRHPAGGVRRGPWHAAHDHVAILVCPRICKALLQVGQISLQLSSLLRKPSGFDFESHAVGLRQPFCNCSHCTLKLFATVEIALKHTHAK